MLTPDSGSPAPWDYRRLFPWLRLFDAFWIALQFRQILTCALGLVAMAGGLWLLNQIVFPTDPPYPTWPIGHALVFERLPWDAVWVPQRVLRPLAVIFDPLKEMAEPGGPPWYYQAAAGFWALIVWSVFGGAAARMAAVRLARNQAVSLRSALAFSSSRVLDLVSAPLLPLGGLTVLWGLCALAGLCGRIPVVGESLAALLYGPSLCCGFVMFLIIVGVAAGWPLMVATVSTEATDGFDGLSRAFNYVFERPGTYALLSALAVAIGSLGTLIVSSIGRLVLLLANSGFASGLGADSHSGRALPSPSTLFTAPPMDLVGAARTGELILMGWGALVSLVCAAFVYSYFWTASTVLYFLVRQMVDSSRFDEVYLEEVPDEDILAGIEPPPTSRMDTPLTERAAPDQTGPTRDAMATPAPHVDLAP